MDHAETITLADGARIATWTRAGPAEAPHVVLLHGGPGLWDYLEPLAGLIGDEATTHRYDQRGCGASSPSDEQSVARSVADLDELRAHWGVDRFVPIGHSFGATLALAYAAAYPSGYLRSATSAVSASATGARPFATSDAGGPSRSQRDWPNCLCRSAPRTRRWSGAR